MASGSSGVRSRSEWLVFSGKDDDFPVWVDRFEAYMRLKKLYAVMVEDYTLPTRPVTPATGADPAVVTQYDLDLAAFMKEEFQWMEDKILIWCELVQFLDKELLIMRRHDCKNYDPKAWRELQGRFKSAEKPRVMTLMTQLTSLKLGGGESMELYLNRAREISYNLQEVKEPVSDSMLTSLVLRGLPEMYSSFVTVQNFSTADFAETRRKLQSFADNLESQRKFDNGASDSFAMYGNYRGGRGGVSRGHRRGNSGSRGE